jgi:hypothetical protein
MLITVFFAGAMLFALLALAFPAARGIQFVAIGVASVAAVLAAARSVGEERYFWFSGFVAIALLLNPIGAMWFNRISILGVLAVCLAMLASWIVLRWRSRQPPSIAPVATRETRASSATTTNQVRP